MFCKISVFIKNLSDSGYVLFAALLWLSLIPASFSSAEAQPILKGSRSIPVEGDNGMVVTSHTLATKAALRVLKEGGNAIDAAVTAAFALAVTQPRSGNIGGGGFMLISSEKRVRSKPSIIVKRLLRRPTAICI